MPRSHIDAHRQRLVGSHEGLTEPDGPARITLFHSRIASAEALTADLRRLGRDRGGGLAAAIGRLRTNPAEARAHAMNASAHQQESPCQAHSSQPPTTLKHDL
jgi:hypothetical protein